MSTVGKNTYRKRALDEYAEVCVSCRSKENIEIHHINGDREKATIENLIPLCGDCHNDVESESWVSRPIDLLRSIKANSPLLKWLIAVKRAENPRMAKAPMGMVECAHPYCREGVQKDACTPYCSNECVKDHAVISDMDQIVEARVMSTIKDHELREWEIDSMVEMGHNRDEIIEAAQ